MKTSEVQEMQCICGGVVRVESVPDVQGSKEGVMYWTHDPPVKCKEFDAVLDRVTRRHGALTLSDPRKSKD